MKKLITFCLILLICGQVNTVFAQENKFGIGLELGPNYTFLYGNPFLKADRKTAIKFYRGWHFQYNLNKVLSLRTGLAFEQLGHKKEIIQTDQNGNVIGMGTAKVNYSYLTLPLLLRATFGQKIHYFVNAGPFVSYALKQTTTVESPQYPVEEIDDSKFLKPYNFGISAGAGVAFPVATNLDLSFEIRNNLGLLNISDVQVIDNGSIKTNAVNFLVGVTYNFGTTDPQPNKTTE